MQQRAQVHTLLWLAPSRPYTQTHRRMMVKKQALEGEVNHQWQTKGLLSASLAVITAGYKCKKNSKIRSGKALAHCSSYPSLTWLDAAVNVGFGLVVDPVKPSFYSQASQHGILVSVPVERMKHVLNFQCDSEWESSNVASLLTVWLTHHSTDKLIDWLVNLNVWPASGLFAPHDVGYCMSTCLTWWCPQLGPHSAGSPLNDDHLHPSPRSLSASRPATCSSQRWPESLTCLYNADRERKRRKCKNLRNK